MNLLFFSSLNQDRSVELTLDLIRVLLLLYNYSAYVRRYRIRIVEPFNVFT